MAKFSHCSSIAQKKALSDQSQAHELVEGGQYSLYKINRLPEKTKREIYACLIPPAIFTKFGIDPGTMRNGTGESVFTCYCQPRTSLVRIELRHKADFPDPVFLLEMRDTSFGDLEILFLNLNNPCAERFNIDRDPEGNDTVLGTVSRNLFEELRAMQSGLAPGQTRRGLRMFRSFLGQANLFCHRLGITRVKIEPMAYHNAIMHEFYGFRYMSGRERMLEIDLEFAPGGVLFNRLNASTPFRQPGLERSVKGRSWAIHDGILEQPWQCPRMYYAIDEPADRVYDQFTCHVFQRHYQVL